MDKKLIIDEIQALVETIAEQSLTISKYDGNIPQIELDIIKVNIRDLYEAFFQLDKQNRKNDNKPIESTKIKTEISSDTIINPEIRVTEEELSENENTDETKLIEFIEPEDNNTKGISNEIPIDKPVEKPIEKPVEKPIEKPTKKSVDLFSDAPNITDKFKNDAQSINEKMAQSKNDATIAGKIKQAPINDLKIAIGINEKFRFVNELFEGNLSDYNESINKLNTFNDLESAEQYLNTLAIRYRWDNNSNTFLILKEMLSRRYQK